jgi:hypothetical protein
MALAPARAKPSRNTIAGSAAGLCQNERVFNAGSGVKFEVMECSCLYEAKRLENRPGHRQRSQTDMLQIKELLTLVARGLEANLL